ncbi:hypothetical protein [Campylobacter sp. RM16192]|uniref:hypothetical protein n=1 Tax=Campylobacter sp. RM16192 TaxID=1660080 RepID=UPI001639EC7B|nr:hypothetical protein [Campylobacter sp. RM16192]
MSKDRLLKAENERKECLSVLKECFSKAINRVNINYTELNSNVENLCYLSIIRINNIENELKKFILSLNDFKYEIIGEEAFASDYKILIEKIYDAEIPFMEYAEGHWGFLNFKNKIKGCFEKIKKKIFNK